MGFSFFGFFSSRFAIGAVGTQLKFWLTFCTILLIIVLMATWPDALTGTYWLLGLLALELLVTLRYVVKKLSSQQRQELENESLDFPRSKREFASKL